jgi:hypothetical protein
MIISLSNAYDTNLFTIKGINDTLTTIFNQKSNQIIKKKTDMSMGDAVKGKEIFVNRIKFYCDISDDEFLPIHTQDEWEAIVQAGKFKEEILEICPKLKDIYKDKWSADLYQFFYEYASDSGNILLF